MTLVTVFYNDSKLVAKIAMSCIRKLHHPTTEAIAKYEGVAFMKNQNQLTHLKEIIEVLFIIQEITFEK